MSTLPPEPVDVPSALSEPLLSPPARWVAFLTLASIGLWAGFFGPIQVLLAQQAEAIDPVNKKEILSFVLGVGAFTSVICNPLFGAFSDRTTLRMGRRLPWVVGGAAGGALSLGVLSVADNVVVMALGWCGVQAALNAMLAAVTATIPDQVPVGRRGRVGGILAIAQTLGVVGGTGIASATGSIAAGYLATAAVLILLTLPYSFDSRDHALPRELREPFDLRRFARSFWISPREYPDFAWAWLTRFLVNLGNAVGLLYLLYFMQDVVGFSSDEAADRVFLLTAIYALTLVMTTVVFGIWSDRSGRRKVFVIWSGIVAGSAALLLGAGQSWSTAAVAAAVMGCGFGIYTSVDFAHDHPGASRRRGPGQGPRRHQHRERAPAGLRPDPGQRHPAGGRALRRSGGDRRRRVLGRLLRGVRRRVRRQHPRVGVRHPDPLGALRWFRDRR